MPSTDVSSTGPYGVYHSVFDNFAWFKKFGDPDFIYEQQMARIFGISIIRMADADVLPYDYEEYAKEIVSYIETAKEFAFDVYNTVKRIHNNMDQKAYAAEIAQKVGWDPKFVIFKEILDEVTQRAVAELLPRWKDRLAMADVFMESHVQTALIYVRWDDKL